MQGTGVARTSSAPLMRRWFSFHPLEQRDNGPGAWLWEAPGYTSTHMVLSVSLSCKPHPSHPPVDLPPPGAEWVPWGLLYFKCQFCSSHHQRTFGFQGAEAGRAWGERCPSVTVPPLLGWLLRAHRKKFQTLQYAF